MTGAEQQTGLRNRLRNVVSMLTESPIEEDKAMIKYKANLQLTKKERGVLELLMFSPIPIVFAVLYTTHSFLWTLIAFHVALTVGPIMFLRHKKIQIDWMAMLKQDLTKYVRNFNNDLILAAIPSLFFTGAYVLFRNVLPNYDYSALRLPSVNDQFIAILLAIEFIIINPVIEELFWRVFCDLFTGQGKTVSQKVDVAIHFGLYHFFVAFFITQDFFLSAGGSLAIATLGYILTIAKQRYGLVTGMIIHIGVDLAVGIVALDMQARFIPFY